MVVKLKDYMTIKGADLINNETMQVKLTPSTKVKRDLKINPFKLDLEDTIKNLTHNIQQPITIAYIPVSEWRDKNYRMFDVVTITIDKEKGDS